MKARKIMAVAGTAFILGTFMPGTAFATEYQTDVISTIKTGDISIHLKDYETGKNGREKVYEDKKLILPGQTISKITRITNEGNTAWVRIKPEWRGDEALDLSLDMIGGISTDWKQIGDYFYYTKPLEVGESIDFGKTISFPPEWTEAVSDQSFYLYMQVDAVQEANFTPNWESPDPWFGTVIKQCSHTVHPVSSRGNQQFSISFEGGAEGLIHIGDDFFSNFGNLMPGDSLTETAKIGNNYNQPVAIYFSAENVDNADILQKITLEIKNDEDLIYSGSLSSPIDKQLLGTYSRGDTSDFTFTISLPADLKNNDALKEAQVRWIFSAEVKSSGSSNGGKGSHSGSITSDQEHGPGINPTEKPSKEPDAPTPTEPSPIPDLPFDLKVPDTGDHFAYGAGLALIGSIGVAAYAIKKSKEEEKKDDDEKTEETERTDV